MTVDEVVRYYKNSYQFHKKTGMSPTTLCNWQKWGYVPWTAQVMLEYLTGGQLMANKEHRR